MHIQGVVTQGYRIASGSNQEGIPGPGGVILKDSFVRQRPFFEAVIPEMKYVWTGTINLSVAPKEAHMLAFDHQITCEWHPGVTETFGIVSGVTLHTHGKSYPGCFIYYPMPSEIHTPRHDMIELLAPKIEGLVYGDEISIDVSDDKVTIRS